MNFSKLFKLKMKWPYFYRFVPATFVVLVLLMLLRSALIPKPVTAKARDKVAQVAASSQSRSSSLKKSATTAKSSSTQSSKPSIINWRKPSESQAYPNVSAHPNMEFDVDTTAQRVYLRDNGKTLYTMYASTGMANSTPKGTYAIQAERGYSFYNAREQMGAHYYTSWLKHGKYLFHSVPTNANGNYIVSEAEKLGKEPASHGCVRVSVADAKWILNNAKVGMVVKIY